MVKKRNAQGLSINTIVVAVIGLIVIIVLIAIFTGRIGSFGKGLDETKSCESVCNGLGMVVVATGNAGCGNEANEQQITGTFGDVADGNVCCCSSR